MNLVAPTFLIALALLVPVLIAFLVRKQRNVLRVPSTMVWRLSAKSTVKNRRIRDIRRLIALLACLLGVAALVFAASRPSGKKAGTHVFIVDVSASMSGAPIVDARIWLTREVAAMGPSSHIAIIAAGSDARIVLPPSPPGPLADDAIQSLAATSDIAAMDEAIVLAEGLAGRDATDARVVVLTDQPIDSDVSRASIKPLVHVFTAKGVGASRDNLGIASLFTRTPPDARDDEEREATVAISTSSTKARRAHLVMTLAGRPIADRRIEIADRGETIERVTIRGGGKLVAKVSSDDGKTDAIAIDDEASLLEVARRAPRVALFRTKKTVDDQQQDGAAAFFLERAIRASGVTDLTIVDPATEDRPSKLPEVAVVLADGPGRPKEVPSFFIGVEPQDIGMPFRVANKTETHIRSIATEDPLLRGVALDEMTTLRSKIASPAPPGSRTLVDLDAGPACVAGGAGLRSWVWLGIDPEASDLVLRVAFPVLVGNVLSELGGASQIVIAKTVPRSEVMLTNENAVITTPLASAPEPSWRIPTSPAILLAMVGAMLLALEAWLTFRRKWAT